MGTPGRLRDHLERGSLDLSCLRACVLDEADEMLDLGFREDLEFILTAAPADRRTLMFSATVPPAIARLAAEFQRDALRVVASGEARQHRAQPHAVELLGTGRAIEADMDVGQLGDQHHPVVGCPRRDVTRCPSSRS